MRRIVGGIFQSLDGVMPGAIPIGSFQMAQPSEAEHRRQERMKREG